MSYFTHRPDTEAKTELILTLLDATDCGISHKALKTITGFKLPVANQLGSSDPKQFVYLPQLVIDIKTYSDKHYLFSEIESNLEMSYQLKCDIGSEELYEDLGFVLYGEVTLGHYNKITPLGCEPRISRREPTINYDVPFAVFIATVKTKHQQSDGVERKLLARDVKYTLMVNTVTQDPESVLAATLKHIAL